MNRAQRTVLQLHQGTTAPMTSTLVDFQQSERDVGPTASQTTSHTVDQCHPLTATLVDFQQSVRSQWREPGTPPPHTWGRESQPIRTLVDFHQSGGLPITRGRMASGTGTKVVGPSFACPSREPVS
jgi:hypothetical protein